MRKPVVGISDQVLFKPATETSKSLEILHIETTDIIPSKQRITKALIRLRPDAQADLRLCCSHMAKTGFLMTWLIFAGNVICIFVDVFGDLCSKALSSFAI